MSEKLKGKKSNSYLSFHDHKEKGRRKRNPATALVTNNISATIKTFFPDKDWTKSKASVASSASTADKFIQTIIGVIKIALMMMVLKAHDFYYRACTSSVVSFLRRGQQQQTSCTKTTYVSPNLVRQGEQQEGRHDDAKCGDENDDMEDEKQQISSARIVNDKGNASSSSSLHDEVSLNHTKTVAATLQWNREAVTYHQMIKRTLQQVLPISSVFSYFTDISRGVRGSEVIEAAAKKLNEVATRPKKVQKPHQQYLLSQYTKWPQSCVESFAISMKNNIISVEHVVMQKLDLMMTMILMSASKYHRRLISGCFEHSSKQPQNTVFPQSILVYVQF